MAIGKLDLASTDLYRRLVTLTATDATLPTAASQLCSESASRLRLFPSLHSQYTLHDEVHCLRVVVLMGKLLGDRINALNAVELTLLMLAAYNHDQGMIVEADELAGIRSSQEWRLHQSVWFREHANRAEILAHLNDPLLSEDQKHAAALTLADLDAAAFTDFVR